MADIHDYLAASRETDEALMRLRTYGGQVEDDERSGEKTLAMSLLLAAEVVTLAIREFKTRLDYVLRDIDHPRKH